MKKCLGKEVRQYVLVDKKTQVDRESRSEKLHDNLFAQ